MKGLRLVLLLLVASLVWGPHVTWAKRQGRDTARETAGEQGWQENQRARWRDLSPEQQEMLKQRYREFQQMPAEQRQKLRRRYERFQELSPASKQRMLERHQRLQRLTPEQRQQLHQEWQGIRQLPPEEQRRRRQELRQRYLNGNGG